MKGHFKIFSQNPDNGDPNTLPPALERELLARALADALPHLPPKLKKIATRVTYVVNHTHMPVTQYYMGWSAEDDPEYRAGDRKFFDPRLPRKHPRNGTIKVSVTQKFIKTLAMTQELGKTHPLAAKGGAGFARALIAHELLHAYQYHTKPARGLDRAACPGGICDLKRLKEAEAKIEYELDAAEIEFPFIDKPSFRAFARALDTYEKKHPREFENGGRWWLLSSSNHAPLGEYYFRQKAAHLGLHRKFHPLAKPTYDGQVVPPRLVHELKRLNDRGRRDERALKNILRRWSEFCEPGRTDLLARIRKTFPYLNLVNARFKRELKRYRGRP